MATRDRTALFIQYRTSFGRSATPAAALGSTGRPGGAQQPLLSDDRATLLQNADSSAEDQHVIEMAQLPPRWMDVVDEVEDDIKQVKAKINQLDALQKKHLLPGFADVADDDAAIEQLSTDITRSFQKCGLKIKKIATETAQSNSAHEQVLGRNVQTSLATKLQEVSSQFRKSQTNYLQKIRGRDSRGNALFEEFAGKTTAMDAAMPNAMDVGFNSQQMEMIHQNDQAIDQRTNEINDIIKSINELADIFRDLQTMVIDQGTLLDRIDYNIEQTAASMKTANKELIAGEKYQKKAQAKTMIIVLGVIILILLIIVFIKHGTKK